MRLDALLEKPKPRLRLLVVAGSRLEYEGWAADFARAHPHITPELATEETAAAFSPDWEGTRKLYIGTYERSPVHAHWWQCPLLTTHDL